MKFNSSKPLPFLILLLLFMPSFYYFQTQNNPLAHTFCDPLNETAHSRQLFKLSKSSKSFTLLPNASPVGDFALHPRRLVLSQPPSQLPPSTWQQDLPDPPPATVPSPSILPIFAPPPTDSPTALSSTPAADSPQPPSPIPPASSPIPPTNSPLPPSPPSSPIPISNSPPPPSPIPPADSPPPPSPIPPADFPPPPSPIPTINSSPPPLPPSSPSPLASSPSPPSPIQPTNSPPPPSSPSPPASSPPPPPSPISATISPPPPSPPSSPSPRASSPPPPTSPSKFPPTPPSNPSPGSPPLPSFSPPLSVPPSNSVPSRNSKSVPPKHTSVPPKHTSVPPRNSPSFPPRPILSPPPHTPLSLSRATNSSSLPVNTLPPPPPPSINSSSQPVSVVPPPPFRRLAPSPSEVIISPPISPNNNDSSPNRPSSNAGIGTGGIVGITSVLGIVLLTTIITVSWCLLKRKKKIAGHNARLYGLSASMGSLPQSSLLKIQASAVEIGNLSANGFVYSPQESGGLGNSTSKFTYEDLYEATNGFSSQNLLGSGGFGYVYKGLLVDGTEVAVKELKIGGGQGEREFSAEVEIISRIHHRYLVSLVGYCISENKRLLVYEYVPNNTLYYHLHVSEVLDWPSRVRVASGAARGIAYLHEDCHPRVIHRDIKSSNILLDKNFEARVSDFGLAKLAADAHTHVTTRVIGTFGYLAPEYARSGNLSEKSDVFSFGVVLLELITGRKPVDVSQPLGDEGLVEWARPLLSHALETEDFKLLVDPRLGMNFVPNEMFRMIEAAAACIRHSATKRPRMGQIVRAFESLETEDLNNGMRIGESEIYNSAQQSAEIHLFQRMAFGSRNYSTDYFTQGSWATNSTDW